MESVIVRSLENMQQLVVTRSHAFVADEPRDASDDLEDFENNHRAFVDLIKRRIVLRGDLTDEQKDRITYIAKRCPLHRTIESKPRIEDRVEVV